MSSPTGSLRARHPGLQAVLAKVARNQAISTDEADLLSRQISLLRDRARDAGSLPPVEDDVTPDGVESRDRLAGCASRQGTERLKRGADPTGFYRAAQDLMISSTGIGICRGASDPATDAYYADSVRAALRGGINLIDTSLCYRNGRSERAVAAGIRRFIEEDGGKRDEIVVSTKAGYLIAPAVCADVSEADVAGGKHSIAPGFLRDQLERSRTNLGLETIDIYYLHNPEVQLKFVDAPCLMRRIRAALEMLERCVSDGLIRYFGIATWNGLYDRRISLPELARTAREVGGDSHHFRFVQLPVNLGLAHALRLEHEDGRTLFEIAGELDITVVGSCALLHGRLARDLPRDIVGAMAGLKSDAQRAMQFARSVPGVGAALVGMQSVRHVAESLELTKVSRLSAAEYELICRAASALTQP